MSNIDDANDFLMGSGGRYAKFEKIGDKFTGTVTDLKKTQQTDFDTGEPLFWDDGNPRMQLVVTIATDLNEGNDDDGLRRLYVKGHMLTAVREAVRKAGARGLDLGGTLTVKYVSDAEPKKKGMRGAKQYAAKYEPPTTSLDDDDLV